MHETCLKEEQWGELKTTLKYLTESMNRIEKRVLTHVEEGDRPGGFRDRLLILERDVSIMKKGYWIAAVVGGVIGGMLGSSVPEAFAFIFKVIK